MPGPLGSTPNLLFLHRSPIHLSGGATVSLRLDPVGRIEPSRSLFAVGFQKGTQEAGAWVDGGVGLPGRAARVRGASTGRAAGGSVVRSGPAGVSFRSRAA